MKTIIKSLLFLMLFAVSEAASAIAVMIQDKEVTVLNTTSESATIAWKKAVRTDGKQAPLYYRIYWQQREDKGFGPQLPYPQIKSPIMADVDTYTMRIDMHPNTKYDVWIEVYDTYGGKEYLNYESFDFTTKGSDYKAPSIKTEYSLTYLNRALNNALDVSVHYAFEPETMQASSDFDYVVLYKKSSESTYKRHSCIGKRKNGAMNYYIDNLEQNTEYDILPVVTKDGKSNYYDVLTVSTANIDDVKPTMTNSAVTVSDVTTNSATLKWTLATDNMTPKNDLVYHIYLSRPGFATEKEYTVTGGYNTCTLTDLQPGTDYIATLKVTDNAMNWIFYENSYFTTKAEEASYPITVAGIDVKGSNRNDVLGDGGSVKYNPISNILTLTNLTLSADEYAGNFISYSYNKNLTIKLVGESQIGSRIEALTNADVIFTGDGTLDVSARDGSVASSGGNLIVEGGCTLKIKGTASPAIVLNNAKITVNNSTLIAQGTTNNHFWAQSIKGCSDLVLINAEIKSAHHYDKSSGKFLSNDTGDEVSGEIIISPKAPDTTAPTVSNKAYTVENVTYNGFTIRWEKATDDVTPASDIKYTIGFVKASEYTGYSWPIAASNLYDVDSYTFTNLESGETYLVKVWAYDAAGNKVEYERKEITTLSLDQNAPFASNKDLTITDVTSDGFTVNWTPAEDDVTPADGLVYDVYIAEVPDDDIYEYSCYATLVGATSCTITGLDPEKAYVIAVTVMDAEGNFDEGGYNELYSVVINNLTPVESIKADKVMNDGKMYNPAGVEVGNDYRGIVIINGKKYFKNK